MKNILDPLFKITHPILIVFFLTENMLLDAIPIVKSTYGTWEYSIILWYISFFFFFFFSIELLIISILFIFYNIYIYIYIEGETS